jgi:hypothetical protein
MLLGLMRSTGADTEANEGSHHGSLYAPLVILEQLC